MKAVVWQGVGEIGLEEVAEPKLLDQADAIVRITGSAICGTDLHFVRGTMPGMRPGTILGHEAVGTVEELGRDVRNFAPGDRVVIPSTIGCGRCAYCRAGHYAQCDVANPNGPQAGTAFYGGPESTGPFDGLQAEYARVPYAHTNLVAIPPGVTDEQALMTSDIFPTAWFGCRLAEVGPGDVVLVLGAGPVGQLTALSARMQGAGRVLIVDGNADRLENARLQNAETIDFNAEDPVETVMDLTGGTGADRVIDAVGVDAERPAGGPATGRLSDEAIAEYERERARAQGLPESAAGDPTGTGGTGGSGWIGGYHEDYRWVPGNAPSQALRWAVEMAAKAGTIGIVGVYPHGHTSFPLGTALNRNLTVRAGNCDHRRYVPGLLSRIAGGHADPSQVMTQQETIPSAIDAYEAFDRREPGWTKVVLEVAG
jgi:threonine dehydrogenase-like Zn-dependent dehydrogenase